MKLQTLKPGLRVLPMRAMGTLPAGEARMRGGSLQTLRARWFSLHPLCVACEVAGRVSAARELDHIVPLWKGGTDTDPNRQGLCIPCHAAKTRAELIERASLGGGWSKSRPGGRG